MPLAEQLGCTAQVIAGPTVLDFDWHHAGSHLPASAAGDGWCVRDAFCELFRWPVGSDEWLAFVEGPHPEDMDRLTEHLGLEWFDPGHPAHIGPLSERLDHPGATCWKLHAVRMSHVIYQPHLRYERPLPEQYWPFQPERFRVLVDARQEPHPLWRGPNGIEIFGERAT